MKHSLQRFSMIFASLLIFSLSWISTTLAETTNSTIPNSYPLAGQRYIGFNEVTNETDDRYSATWTDHGDLVLEEPENAQSFVVSIVIANGSHFITGTQNCTLYTDENKSGDVWENPDQTIILSGNAQFTINAADGKTAWAVVKCVRPLTGSGHGR